MKRYDGTKLLARHICAFENSLLSSQSITVLPQTII